jgi:hypothetical protein
LVQGSFDLQATREAAEAVQDSDGRIKTRSQAAAEQVLQMHDKLHSSWVDLTLGMTKLQKEEHARQQAIQALVQAKTKGLNCNYNFEDTHSINPIEGRSDNGTALTRTNNVSLGETAYDVVQQSNESDLEDVLNNPYSNKDETPKVNLEMNEVHRNLERTVRMTMSSSSDNGGSNSKSSAASDQEEGHDATIGNNDEGSSFADGGGDKSGHTVPTQELAKTSLQTTEATPSQDQVHTPNRSEGLALAEE